VADPSAQGRLSVRQAGGGNRRRETNAAGIIERLPRSIRIGANAGDERLRSRRQHAEDDSETARGRCVKSRDSPSRKGRLAGPSRGSDESQKRERQNRREYWDTQEQKIRAKSSSGTHDRDAKRRRAEINLFTQSQPPDARSESSEKGCRRCSSLNQTERDDETVGRACSEGFLRLVSSATRSSYKTSGLFG